MANLINTNSDFLFIYEAINCNPNGDPDMENKPRMDYDTNTNLVTDVRIKRYIRDYLINLGQEIFVSTYNDLKVKPENKLKEIINSFNEVGISNLFNSNCSELEQILSIYNNKGTKPFFNVLITKEQKMLGNLLLTQLVKKRLIDIRMFGSTFAIENLTNAMTGPIQLTWGYSLNKVKLIDTSAIVTIMNDDNSTFGKDYRLYYSLIAFHGTINKAASVSTGLTEEDKETFRNAIWNSISATPTRSKLNQYPKLYVEFEYNNGYANGQFGDLRNFIKCTPKTGIDNDAVRKFDDLQLDLSDLITLINNNKGDDKVINNVIVKSSPDINLNI